MKNESSSQLAAIPNKNTKPRVAMRLQNPHQPSEFFRVVYTKDPVGSFFYLSHALLTYLFFNYTTSINWHLASTFDAQYPTICHFSPQYFLTACPDYATGWTFSSNDLVIGTISFLWYILGTLKSSGSPHFLCKWQPIMVSALYLHLSQRQPLCLYYQPWYNFEDWKFALLAAIHFSVWYWTSFVQILVPVLRQCGVWIQVVKQSQLVSTLKKRCCYVLPKISVLHFHLHFRFMYLNWPVQFRMARLSFLTELPQGPIFEQALLDDEWWWID